MSFIQDVPRTLVLNGFPFTGADIFELKQLFPVLDMVNLKKRRIRQDILIQKAMQAGALLCLNVQTSNDCATLNLTQDGKLLVFDAAGNQLAQKALEASKKQDGLAVKVSGKQTGELIEVKNLKIL